MIKITKHYLVGEKHVCQNLQHGPNYKKDQDRGKQNLCHLEAVIFLSFCSDGCCKQHMSLLDVAN